MPYKTPTNGVQPQQCEVCGSPANIRHSGFYSVVDCSRCGDFQMDRETEIDLPKACREARHRALASHLIRRMQGGKRPILGSEFLSSLSRRTLPTPIEMSDNLLLTIAERVEGRPGTPIRIGAVAS
jgi:hypothetical protein